MVIADNGINIEIGEVFRLLDDDVYCTLMAQANDPYGDGLACERIIEFIK